MPSESEQHFNFQCRLYAEFCKGRLGIGPAPDCGGPEMAAHALGVEEMGKPLPSLPAVVAAVAQLLSGPSAPKPQRNGKRGEKRSLSPRVLEILADMGLSPGDFHAKGPFSTTTIQALQARRFVVRQLRAENLTYEAIEAATGIGHTSVWRHLQRKAKSA